MQRVPRKDSRSRKPLGVLATVALAATVTAGVGTSSAATINLIDNGDFEENFDGWTAEKGGTLELSDDGYGNSDHSLKIVDRTASQSGPFHQISGAISEGDTVRVSAQLKYEDGDPTKKFNFTLCPDGFSGDICEMVASTNATKGEWASLEAEFTASTSEWDWAFFENDWTEDPDPNDLPDFKIDDVSIVVITSEGTILPAGNFEAGFDGWTTDAEEVGREVGADLAIDSDEAFEGDQSLRVTDRRNTFSGPHARLLEDIEPGATYQFNAAIKYVDGPDTKPFIFTLCDPNFTGEGCVNLQEVEVDKGEWTEFNTEWVAPQGDFTWALFEVPWKSDADTDADDLMDFWIDDVSLVKTADAPEDPTDPERLAVEDVLVKQIGDHNPINPWKFGADPHGIVWGDRLYVYATNDNEDYVDRDKDEYGYATSDGQYNVTTLNLQSTSDMVNWVDHGEVPVAGPDGIMTPASRSWAPASIAREVENPETGEMEEKVFLYFSNGAAGTAVLMGDSPGGPWRDVRAEAGYTGNERMLISAGNPIEFKEAMWLFDPDIFIDDDGQAYLYFGGNLIGDDPANHPESTAVVKLRDNMYEVACGGEGEESCEEAVKYIDAPGMFEASTMLKHDGKYYYSYSANFEVQYEEGKYPTPGSIPYMVTEDPMDLQPEHYEGIAFENPNSFFQDAGGNNHSDMVAYKGNYYFLYHARTLGKAWKEGTGTSYQVWANLRNTHVEEMSFNDDGSIAPIEGTYAGPDQLENFNPYGKIEAQTFAWQKGTYFDIHRDEDSSVFTDHDGGNVILTRIHDGDWTGISNVDFGEDGAESFSARVKPVAEGGSIEVRLDDPENGDVVATLPVDSEIGEWAELSTEISGATGIHDVFFVFTGDSDAMLFDADYWEFTSDADAPVTGSVVVEGSPVVGESLMAVTDSWPEGTTFSYQWLVSDAADGSGAGEIDGADDSSLVVSDDVVDRWVGVQLTAVDPDGQEHVVTSSFVGPVEVIDSPTDPDPTDPDPTDPDPSEPTDPDPSDPLEPGEPGDDGSMLPRTGVSIGMALLLATVLIGSGVAIYKQREHRA